MLTPTQRLARITWIEWIKGIALILIVVNHVAEHLFGYPFIANPTHVWPPFAERLAQLAPITWLGLGNIPANLLRYVGWLGDQGVQLFLIASGFGLTYGFLQKNDPSAFSLKSFYQRRLLRIYPQWWVTHGLFMLIWLVTGWGLSLLSPKTYLSLLGLRSVPGMLYYFAGSWWYFGLLVQLYLVFPFLYKLLQRIGPQRFLIGCCLIGFALRAVGLPLMRGNWIDFWHRGAFFVTRLPEFAFGMSLAGWFWRDEARVVAWLRRPVVPIIAGLVWLIGLAVGLTLLGNAIAPFMLGIALFLMLFWLFQKISNAPLLERLGAHSYALYLVHEPLIAALVPGSLEAGALKIIGGILAALVASGLGALLIERVAALAERGVQGWVRAGRLRQRLLRLSLLLPLVYLVLLGAEMLIRQLDPQEVSGWGERASLEPSDTFGWRLKPNQTTHLRWESYDYVVQANGLGFPGKEYPPAKPADALRILITGDAFSSAEGVNTEQAWPRLLEDDLNQAGRKTEVLNFAMTGYGPNQYANVVENFAPRYKPDLIVIEMFVNDYGDVLLSDDWFRDNIGFQLASPNSPRGVLTLSHLRKWHQLATEPLTEWLTGEPSEHGLLLGNFAAFEKDNPDFEQARTQVGAQLARIKAVASGIGAKVFIAMVPASIQVCTPDQLPYYPRAINLADGRFDLDRPQRTTQQLAQSLGISFIDLRQPLQSSTSGACVYQPRNMHWVPAGHQLVAQFMAQYLAHPPQ